ncbi:SpvB/TcaC N-terminal domain-containing protein [uncultured Microscilla sp.]|uniref:SpvB/TcaC N-terminal domain-containing protein n=1 Tax=uncultured Microscilla sp. TaxID=432653 RepID=UPI00260D9B67|nr:SpvB/TcaC N-terminal domain-containing protein [uncultured Microscilla sp.]
MQNANQSGPALKPSLPSAQGSLNGYGGQFKASGFTGAGEVSFGGVTYSTSAGSGEYGFGFGAASGGGISRSTHRHNPTYDDNLDTFELAGTMLVPYLNTVGERVIKYGQLQDETVTQNGQTQTWKRPQLDDIQGTNPYQVRQYRPRTEGSYAQIYYWKREAVVDTEPSSFWQVIGADNSVTFFGVSDTAKVSERNDQGMANPDKVFTWLSEEHLAAEGHGSLTKYLQEDTTGVDTTTNPEQGHVHHNKIYLDRICSGHKEPIPYALTLANYGSSQVAEPEWFFETVWDYGQYDLTDLTNQAIYQTTGFKANWPKRLDSHSDYSGGFEIRCHRLCRQVLEFHYFPEEEAFAAGTATTPLLHSATEYLYDKSAHRTLLVASQQVGYYWNGASYEAKYTTPVEMAYQAFDPKPGGAERPYRLIVDKDTNQPLTTLGGADAFLPVDLYGEGIEGFLASDGYEAYYYQTDWDSIEGKMGTGENIAYTCADNPIQLPVGQLHQGAGQFMDLNGNGKLDYVVVSEGHTLGYYEAQQNAHNDATGAPIDGWSDFTPIAKVPTEFGHPRQFLTDITGNKRVDCVLPMYLNGQAQVRYYQNNGAEGFEAGEEVTNVSFQTNVTSFASSEKIYIGFLDIAGDGKQHLVRLDETSLVYYPNYGYGAFGDPITLDVSHIFNVHEFRLHRLHFADLDGTGTADLIVAGRDGIHIYLNECGNGFAAQAINVAYPEGHTYDDHTTNLRFTDVFGNGLTCMIFQKMGAHQAGQWVYDFNGGEKPYLMTQHVNNMGATTETTYRSSVHFYLEDQANKVEWFTRAPFPTWSVKQVTVTDAINGNVLTEAYHYRHSYYDGEEKTFRGYGYAEHEDTATFSSDAKLKKLDSPPAKSCVWYHSGNPAQDDINALYEKLEYFMAGEQASDTTNKDTATQYLSIYNTEGGFNETEELKRQAQLHLAGSVIRSEVYGKPSTDDSSSWELYSASMSNETIKLIQGMMDDAVQGNVLPLLNYASFQVLPRESLGYHYERQLDDPIVGYSAALSFDAYGHVLQSCAIQYPRRSTAIDAQANAEITAQQQTLRCMVSQAVIQNFSDPATDLGTDYAQEQFYLLGVPTHEKSYFVVNPRNIGQLDGKDGSETNVFSEYEGGIYNYGQLLDYFDVNIQGQGSEFYYFEEQGAGNDIDDFVRLLHYAEHAYYYVQTNNNNGTLSALNNFEAKNDLDRPGSRAFLLPKSTTAAVMEKAGLEAELVTEQSFFTSPELATLMTSGQYSALTLSLNGTNTEYWATTPGTYTYGTATQFYNLQSYTDPMGSTTTSTHDYYNLMVVSSEDALGNVSQVAKQETFYSDGTTCKRAIDYQLLHPYRMVDPNGNTSEVMLDALGRAVTSSHYGTRQEVTKSTSDDFYAGLNADHSINIDSAFTFTGATDVEKQGIKQAMLDVFAESFVVTEADLQALVIPVDANQVAAWLTDLTNAGLLTQTGNTYQVTSALRQRIYQYSYPVVGSTETIPVLTTKVVGRETSMEEGLTFDGTLDTSKTLARLRGWGGSIMDQIGVEFTDGTVIGGTNDQVMDRTLAEGEQISQVEMWMNNDWGSNLNPTRNGNVGKVKITTTTGATFEDGGGGNGKVTWATPKGFRLLSVQSNIHVTESNHRYLGGMGLVYVPDDSATLISATHPDGTTGVGGVWVAADDTLYLTDANAQVPQLIPVPHFPGDAQPLCIKYESNTTCLIYRDASGQQYEARISQGQTSLDSAAYLPNTEVVEGGQVSAKTTVGVNEVLWSDFTVTLAAEAIASEGFTSLYDANNPYQVLNPTNANEVISSPMTYLQEAANFVYYQPFSWMGQVTQEALKTAVNDVSKEASLATWYKQLISQGLINGEGALFKSMQALVADAAEADFFATLTSINPNLNIASIGLSSGQTTAIFDLFSNAGGVPVHVLTTSTKDYPTESNAKASYDQLVALAPGLGNHQAQVGAWFSTAYATEPPFLYPENNHNSNGKNTFGILTGAMRTALHNSNDVTEFVAQLNAVSSVLANTFEGFGNVKEAVFYFYKQQVLGERIEQSLEYSDGLGRPIQTKLKAEGGTDYYTYNATNAAYEASISNLKASRRWLTQGHVVYNNKGQTVLAYDSYYIDTPGFVAVDNENGFNLLGTSPIHYYDPMGRVTHSITPKGYLQAQQWTAWGETHWDANDALLLSPYYQVNKQYFDGTQSPVSNHDPDKYYFDYTDQRLEGYTTLIGTKKKIADSVIEAIQKSLKQCFTPSVSVHDNRGLTWREYQKSLQEFTQNLVGTQMGEAGLTDDVSSVYATLAQQGMLNEHTLGAQLKGNTTAVLKDGRQVTLAAGNQTPALLLKVGTKFALQAGSSVTLEDGSTSNPVSDKATVWVAGQPSANGQSPLHYLLEDAALDAPKALRKGSPVTHSDGTAITLPLTDVVLQVGSDVTYEGDTTATTLATNIGGVVYYQEDQAKFYAWMGPMLQGESVVSIRTGEDNQGQEITQTLTLNLTDVSNGAMYPLATGATVTLQDGTSYVLTSTTQGFLIVTEGKYLLREGKQLATGTDVTPIESSTTVPLNYQTLSDHYGKDKPYVLKEGSQVTPEGASTPITLIGGGLVTIDQGKFYVWEHRALTTGSEVTRVDNTSATLDNQGAQTLTEGLDLSIFTADQLDEAIAGEFLLQSGQEVTLADDATITLSATTLVSYDDSTQAFVISGNNTWGEMNKNYPILGQTLLNNLAQVLDQRFALEAPAILAALWVANHQGTTLSVAALKDLLIQVMGTQTWYDAAYDTLWQALQTHHWVGNDGIVDSSNYASYPTVDSNNATSNRLANIALMVGWARGRTFETSYAYDVYGRYTHVADPRFTQSNAEEGLQLGETNAYWNQETPYIGTLGGSVTTTYCDAGQSWALPDVLGRHLWSRDPRNIEASVSYDALHRPLAFTQSSKNAAGNTAEWSVVTSRILYGESLSNAQAYNAVGQAVQTFTQGVWSAMSHGFNILGLPLGAQMAFVKSFEAIGEEGGVSYKVVKPIIDLAGVSLIANEGLLTSSIANGVGTLLQNQLYSQANTFDAIGEVQRSIDAQQNVHIPNFYLSGGVAQMKVNGINFMDEVVYNARKQKLAVQTKNSEGNLVMQCRYVYDPKNYGLLQMKASTQAASVQAGQEYTLLTTNDANTRQSLIYTFDPVGNVASIPMRVYQGPWAKDNNQRLEVYRSQHYTYDGLYRLTEASEEEEPDFTIT